MNPHVFPGISMIAGQGARLYKGSWMFLMLTVHAVECSHKVMFVSLICVQRRRPGDHIHSMWSLLPSSVRINVHLNALAM